MAALAGHLWASPAWRQFLCAARRVTYTSPISKNNTSASTPLLAEVAPALKAITSQPWADVSKLVLAGASEGGVPVARYAGNEFAARMIFAWSCEPNYFVAEPKNALPQEPPGAQPDQRVRPVLSSANTWLGHAIAKGHCGDALKDNKYSTVTLIPGAPAPCSTCRRRGGTAGFLRDALKSEAAAIPISRTPAIRRPAPRAAVLVVVYCSDTFFSGKMYCAAPNAPVPPHGSRRGSASSCRVGVDVTDGEDARECWFELFGIHLHLTALDVEAPFGDRAKRGDRPKNASRLSSGSRRVTPSRLVTFTSFSTPSSASKPVTWPVMCIISWASASAFIWPRWLALHGIRRGDE